MGAGTAIAYQVIREELPFLASDEIMYPYLEKARNLVRNNIILERVEKQLVAWNRRTYGKY